jgi:Spx/MgsR family transcriptional regulator
MIKVYGIKNCGSVRKALNFFKTHNIEVEFFDFKKSSPSTEKIAIWSSKIEINTLMNTKGATYRKLGIKNLNLLDKEKLVYLEKEPLLFKRPVIENGQDIFVAFNEDVYNNKFLNH